MAAERDVGIKHELISAGEVSFARIGMLDSLRKQSRLGLQLCRPSRASTLPVKRASRIAENVRLFDEVIRQAGWKSVLYMTWEGSCALKGWTAETRQPFSNSF